MYAIRGFLRIDSFSYILYFCLVASYSVLGKFSAFLTLTSEAI